MRGSVPVGRRSPGAFGACGAKGLCLACVPVETLRRPTPSPGGDVGIHGVPASGWRAAVRSPTGRRSPWSVRLLLSGARSGPARRGSGGWAARAAAGRTRSPVTARAGAGWPSGGGSLPRRGACSAGGTAVLSAGGGVAWGGARGAVFGSPGGSGTGVAAAGGGGTAEP